ncbi:cytochrome c-type biogenesis protein CcmI [Burkholderiales bacterium JOSHI_001]|nr:cytochrome c-type biogenesis protein CcmI [Burkholderiales bacterium JOSHI_001]
MMAFWSSVALLLAGALLFVLPPLLRREGPGESGSSATLAGSPALSLALHRERQAELDADLARGQLSPAEHASERADLQRRVLEDLPDADPAAGLAAAPALPRAVAWAPALLLPAAALGIYLLLGQPGSVNPAAPTEGGHALTPEQMQGMVARLAERLKTQPDDAEGWHMLARSYTSFGRLADAAQAYDRAAALQPTNPDLLADYADVLGAVNGRKLEGRPLQLIDAALENNPRHPKALALAGTAAYNRQDFAAALSYWQRLQATLAPNSDMARRVVASIAEAQSKLGGAAVAPAGTAAAPAGGATLSGQVQVADNLKARIQEGDTLFIFARAAEGPRMPVAIARVSAGAAAAGPVAFTLDDSSAMQPDRRLSQQRAVVLAARISRSGNATPQSGDLMGTLGPLAPGAKDLRLVIDGVVP